METKVCGLCHSEFTPITYNQRYCEHCRKNRYSEIRSKWDSKTGKLSKLEKKMRAKSINRIVKEVIKYNNLHGTNLSYGQYVQMLENGWLEG